MIPRQNHEVVWNALQEVFMIASEGESLEESVRLQEYFRELQERDLLTNGEVQQLNSL